MLLVRDIRFLFFAYAGYGEDAIASYSLLR